MIKTKGSKLKLMKKVFALFMGLSIMFISGCWSNVELNENAIVIAIGLDKGKDGKIKTIIQTVQPIKVKKREEVPSIVFTSEGETVFESIRNFSSMLGRRLIFTHVEIILLGPNIVKEDVMPYLDYYVRDHEQRLKPSVFFSRQPVEEILKTPSPYEPITAIRIDMEIEEVEKKVGFASHVRFFEFNKMMVSSNGTGYLPIIKIKENEGYPLLVIEDMTVVKNGKRTGDLNQEESRGVLWVDNKIKSGVLNVSLTENKEKNKKVNKISFEILSSKSSIESKMAADKLSVTINIESSLNIAEILGDLPLSKKTLKDIEQKATKEIIKEVKSSLKKTQKWGTDIYGINDVVHREHPDYWKDNKKNWDKIFTDLPIKVNASVKIINYDFLKNSLD